MARGASKFAKVDPNERSAFRFMRETVQAETTISLLVFAKECHLAGDSTLWWLFEEIAHAEYPDKTRGRNVDETLQCLQRWQRHGGYV